MTEQITVRITKRANRTYWMMYYVDPITERQMFKSSKTTSKRDAERAAAKWEADLREGRYSPDQRITWEDFRDRYETEKLASLAQATADAAASAFNHLERLLDPKRLAKLTPATLSKFQADLRAEGMRETTIATHLRHLHAALVWAKSVGLLRDVPQITMPKRAKGKHMRGRPITGEEYDRLVAAVPKVRKTDSERWIRLLKGLWLSGLRLGEAIALSWDDDAPFAIDLSGKHPRFRIWAEAEKAHKDRLLPMTPDAAEFFLETPETQRQGPVFDLRGIYTHETITDKRASRVISDIGEKAGVIVNKADGKFASAHDFRRAFGTRWASKTKPATLQLLMRHSSIETTLKFYVAIDTDDVAAELWKDHAPGFMNTSMNTWPEGTPDSEGYADSSVAASRENKEIESGGQGTRTPNPLRGT